MKQFFQSYNVICIFPATTGANHPPSNTSSNTRIVGSAYQRLINRNANMTFNIRNKIMNEIQIQ